ncbi:MAG TPA: hypothetical protein VD789_06545 [Thermomicrobiales bacterium]|nr:hypothetical protein [Thermomicrobiales bacterium]
MVGYLLPGDKETFRFAWLHLQQPHAIPEGRPDIVHCHWDTPTGPKRTTAALEQRELDGYTLFHHRTGAQRALCGKTPRRVGPASTSAAPTPWPSYEPSGMDESLV